MTPASYFRDRGLLLLLLPVYFHSISCCIGATGGGR